MAISEDMLVFTNSGFKPVKDISGYDKVLVRGFTGEARYIQPFALRKIKYSGEVVDLKGRHWSLTCTPDHKLTMESRYSQARVHPLVQYSARDVPTDATYVLYRKFRYVPEKEHTLEQLTILEKDGRKRSITISNEDWYILMAYTLTRAFVNKVGKKYTIMYYIDQNYPGKIEDVLIPIFDKYGIPWSRAKSAQPSLLISTRCNLARRVVTRLGATKRREMYLPDKMIYGSDRRLVQTFMEAYMASLRKPDTPRRPLYAVSSSNVKMIDSIAMMGGVGGYSVTKIKKKKAGDSSGPITFTRDNYNMQIARWHDSYGATKSRTRHYEGYMYALDILDGQIYTRRGTAPVWVDPN